MSASVADIYEDYLESLQNLPSEIDQNMHELRRMDDDLQKFRETYTKHKRSYVKQFKSSANATSLVATRSQLEKDHKTAMQKQDQKIELAMRMYDLVSRHIERLDTQVAKSGLSESDWISHRSNRKGPTWHDGGQRKRALGSIDGPTRKRIHHSSRPMPSNGSTTAGNPDIDSNEPTYCYCKQVSFGDMIACDGDNCEREWFHYNCVGLVEPPAGKWFCEECKVEEEYRNQSSEDDSTP
ncbi:PHDfinger domain containing protein [Mucor ambiguus]|uniref:Chromatin modification-related protein n=1 Tax=Mucor ambiguus TaxID=91626 RepID=A0A0C9M2X2_9FUNG|nr:PHDfinger domain containing protein [Mucor ambiguus]